MFIEFIECRGILVISLSIFKVFHVLLRAATLTHLSLASLLLDIGKQYSSRCDAAERGVPSGAILFALRIFNETLIKI